MPYPDAKYPPLRQSHSAPPPINYTTRLVVVKVTVSVHKPDSTPTHIIHSMAEAAVIFESENRNVQFIGKQSEDYQEGRET